MKKPNFLKQTRFVASNLRINQTGSSVDNGMGDRLRFMRFATRALRVGQDLEPPYNSVIPPLYQTSTFGWNSLDEKPPFDYTRSAGPNRAALEKVIASLENGKVATVFSSGMAAVMGALSVLSSGDHLLMSTDIYGGTFRIAEKLLPKYGISTSFFDAANPDDLAAKIQSNSKMVMFETPANPNLRVCDIEAIATVAKAKGLLVAFDNTFASPALQNPLDLGADIVIHSTTKYISGHSDVIGGATIVNDEALGQLMAEYLNTVGSCPSPFDCWLSLRGAKTLGCRMEKHSSNALAVAEFLAGHPKIEAVHYPGLPTHPDHEIAKKQMRGGFGGMLAAEIKGGTAAARKLAESTHVLLLAESLGGVESLIAYPPLMSHATMTEEQRLERGIPPHLLRFSIGIEDPQDLIEDLAQALDQI